VRNAIFSLDCFRSLFETSSSQVDLATVEWISRDVHCVSALVKQFFRELPTPLLASPALTEAATAQAANSDSRAALALYASALKRLRPAQYR